MATRDDEHGDVAEQDRHGLDRVVGDESLDDEDAPLFRQSLPTSFEDPDSSCVIPVVEHVGQYVAVSAGWHAREKITADHFAAIVDTGRPEYGRSVDRHPGQIEDKTAQMGVRTQDGCQ